jgi:hypothetical protein
VVLLVLEVLLVVVPVVLVMVVPVVSVPVVPVLEVFIVSVDIVPVVPVVAVSVMVDDDEVSVVTLVSVALFVADSFLQAVPKRASATIVRSTRKVFFILISSRSVLCFNYSDFRAFQSSECLAHLLLMRTRSRRA